LEKYLRKLLVDRDIREVMSGGAVAFVYRVAGMLASYALIWVISRRLGAEGMGVYNLFLAVLSLLIMGGTLGFHTSVVRFVSQYRAQQKSGLISLLYKGILKLCIPVSVGLGAVLFLFAETIAVQAYHDPALTLPLRIAAGVLPIMTVGTLNVELVRGFKLIHISEFFRNLNLNLVTLAGSLIVLAFVQQPEVPVAFYALGGVVSFGFTLVYVLRLLRRESPRRLQRPFAESFDLRGPLLVSLPMILTAFIQVLNGRVDMLMIGLYSPTAEIGIYGVAFKLSILTNFVIGSVKTIALPKISELFWGGKEQELKRMIRFSSRLIFSFAVPVSLVLFLFAEDLLGLLGEEFVAGAGALRILTLTQFINAASGLVAAFMNMTGNERVFAWLVGVATGVNVLLNLVLIPVYGMEGAAVATLISIAIWNIGGAAWIWRRHGIRTFFWG